MTLNNDTDTQIKNLLSLKKFEQPKAEYMEDFHYNFRDFQRQNMLTRKSSVAERLATWWTENVSMPSFLQPSFAGAGCAVLLTAGLILTQVQPSTSSAVLAQGSESSNSVAAHDSRYADAQFLYSDAISQQAEIYTASANTSDDYASARLVHADAGSNYDNLYFF
jgi:hypothetical protein